MLRHALLSLTTLILLPVALIAPLNLAFNALRQALFKLPPDNGLPALFMTLAGLAAGGYAWGRWAARRYPLALTRRMARALAVAYPLCFVLLTAVLSLVEPLALAGNLGRWPLVHRVFVALFAIAAALSAGLFGAVAARTLRRPIWRVAWSGGLAAGVAFVLTDRLMYTLGWRVGHFDFPDRPTMLTVGALGLAAAAALGGAVILRLLPAQEDAAATPALPGQA